MKFVAEIDLDAICEKIPDPDMQQKAVAITLRQMASDFLRVSFTEDINTPDDTPIYLSEMEHIKLGYSVARAQIIDAPFDRSIKLPREEAKHVQHGINIDV